MSSAVRLNSICFSYTQADSPHNLLADDASTLTLRDINLDIPRGQWVTILGANGSGKSTLARIIAGLSAPTSGELSLLDTAVYVGGHVDYAKYYSVREKIGYIFQNPEDQIIGHTVQDDVACGPENLGCIPLDTQTCVEEALRATHMSPYATANPLELSGGQQQRVTVSSALAVHPELIVLDEPFAYADTNAHEAIVQALQDEHKRGTTIVLITHHRSDALLSDRIITLDRGMIVRDELVVKHNELPNVDSAQSKPTQSKTAHSPDISRESIAHAGIPVSSVHDKHDDLKTSHAQRTILDASHVSFSYDKPDKPVLDDISLRIDQGEWLAIAGKNGSGKSTLVSILTGALSPTTGRVNLYPASDSARNPRIGYVMQKAERQLFAQSVYDDIAFGLKNMDLDEADIEGKIHDISQLLGISHTLTLSPWNLSGGQQRLVAIAGVLVMQPDILVLDEPTAHLDEQASTVLLEALGRLHNDGTTIVIISHDLPTITRYASRVLLMDDRGATDELTKATISSSAHSKPEDSSPRALLDGLDPRITTVIATALMVCAFAISSPTQLAWAVLAYGTFVALSGIGLRTLLSSLKLFGVFITFTALFNVFFVTAGESVWSWGALHITDVGLWSSLIYTCRIVLVAFVGLSLVHVVPASRMSDAVDKLCSPLCGLGVPVHDISLVASLALRFLPILSRDTHSIAIAQHLRGGDIYTGTLSSRMRSLQAIIVPALSSALRHADKLSWALDARGFNNRDKRVPWRTMRITMRDYVAVGIAVACMAVLIGLGWISII